MKPETRERFWLPLAIPIGALAFIAIVTFGMSRILLNVPSEIATAVAMMAAFNILVVSALVALRQNLRAPDLGVMGLVALVPLFLGGLVAAGAVEVKGGEEHEEAGESTPVVEVAAEGLKFDKSELNIPADTPFVLSFNNQDAGIPHNVAILKAEGSTEALLRTDLINGPKTDKAEAKPIPAGNYFFQCDVHPDMKGTAIAAEGAGGEPAGSNPTKETPAPPGTAPAGGGQAGGESKGGDGNEVEIAAKSNQFDKKALSVPADKPFKLALNNKDAGIPHNVTILKAKGSSEALFREPPFPGPATKTYEVKALPAGKYFFQCDVHPNMTGEVEAS